MQGSKVFVGKLIRKRDMAETREEREGRVAKKVKLDEVEVQEIQREELEEHEEQEKTEQTLENREKEQQQEEYKRYPKRSNDKMKQDFKHELRLVRAVDCGAGIGRITHGLLLSLARIVDIVEPVPQFTDEISKGELFAPYRSSESASRIGAIHNIGLESFHPPAKTYDLIWNQWCLGQLTDSQLVAYLRRCGPALRKGGWVIVKENVCAHGDGSDVFDEVDSSVTRSEGSFRKLFEKAGMKIVMSEEQRGFPRGLGLFPVKCWALQPVGG